MKSVLKVISAIAVVYAFIFVMMFVNVAISNMLLGTMK